MSQEQPGHSRCQRAPRGSPGHTLCLEGLVKLWKALGGQDTAFFGQTLLFGLTQVPLAGIAGLPHARVFSWHWPNPSLLFCVSVCLFFCPSYSLLLLNSGRASAVWASGCWPLQSASGMGHGVGTSSPHPQTNTYVIGHQELLGAALGVGIQAWRERQGCQQWGGQVSSSSVPYPSPILGWSAALGTNLGRGREDKTQTQVIIWCWCSPTAGLGSTGGCRDSRKTVRGLCWGGR